MILSLESQARLFLLTILLGGALGFFYDCLRIWRRIIAHKKFFVQIEDAIYWIMAIFLAFGVMLYANSGEIRMFTLLGMLGGMGVYFLAISPIIMAISDRVIFVVKKALLLFFTILWTPFRLVLLILRPPARKIGGICVRLHKRVLHSCKICAKIKRQTISRDWGMFLKRKSAGNRGSQDGKEEKNREKKSE